MLRLRTLAVIIFAGLAAACSPDNSHEGVVLNRGNGFEPKSLDPAQIDAMWEANIVGDMMMGLTTEDAAGNPIAGAATDWKASADGLTWTFHIRNHQWSDGTPVTSHDFAFAWRRLLDPKTASQYAYNMWVVKNAQAISNGKLPPSALGVETPDDKTLIVHLQHPAAYLPQLLDHHTAYPVPEHVVEKYGRSWAMPGKYVSNGAYVVTEWVPNDHITLVKNKYFYDAKNVQIDTIHYYPTTDAQAALKRYRSGEIDTQNPFPNMEIGWMRANIPNQIKSVPYMATSYMVMNQRMKIFQDKRLREALNLAVDREALTEKISRIGQPPAYAMVPPGVANFPGTAVLDFKAMPYAERIKKAQALMKEMGYGPNHHLSFTYTTTTQPDNKRTAAALQSMYAQIYIDMQINPVDGQVLFQNLPAHNFQLAGLSWIADFNDATNFLDLLRANSGNNYGSYNNPAYDALLNKAQQMTDLKTRGELLNQAEQMALNDYAWIPVNFGVTRDIVKPYVKGWVANVKNINRTRWLSIVGKP